MTSDSPGQRSASAAHRKALLLFLPLLALTSVVGSLIVAELPGHQVDEVAVLILGALGALASFVVLYWRPEQVDRISMTTVLLIMALFLHRVISILFGPLATNPDYSLFRPIYAFLPLIWISCFVLLQVRYAAIFSGIFWVALMLTLLTRVVPEWELFGIREDFHSLLLFLSLGSPMFIILLALLPKVQRRFADASTIALEREVTLAAQMDEARQRLETALVGSRDAMFDWDQRGSGKIWVSPRFYDLIGRGPAEFNPTPDTLRALVHPEDLEKIDALKVDQAGAASVEFRMLTRTRGYRYVSVRVVKIEAGRKGARFAGSVRDVHVRKEEEERAKAGLRDANDFAKRAAHNLSAPIRRMRMLAERSQRLLGSGEPDLEALASNLGRIVDNSSQSKEFVDALLDYAAALVPHDEQEVDLNHAIADLLGEMQDRISRSNAVVDVGELPVVLGNFEDLKQIFKQLFDNALLYSPRTPTIQVEAQKLKDAAVISVHDRGIGIAPEHLYNIFEPLMRLHSRDEYEGNGLGLAIARTLCAKYRGQLWAESEPGQGAVFRVRLRTPEPHLGGNDG